MDKSEKIEAIVNRLLNEMDLDALQQFYIDMKTFELEDLDDDQLDAYLWKDLQKWTSLIITSSFTKCA